MANFKKFKDHNAKFNKQNFIGRIENDDSESVPNPHNDADVQFAAMRKRSATNKKADLNAGLK